MHHVKGFVILMTVEGAKNVVQYLEDSVDDLFAQVCGEIGLKM